MDWQKWNLLKLGHNVNWWTNSKSFIIWIFQSLQRHQRRSLIDDHYKLLCIHTLSRKVVMANGKANKVINYLEGQRNSLSFIDEYLWMMIPRRLYRTCWSYLKHGYFSLALVLACGKKYKLLNICTCIY